MSKTDKTRPWTVKGYEHIIEDHDHRHGPCDLPRGKPTFEQYLEFSWVGGRRSTRCNYDTQWWRPEFRCGCKMCGYDAYRTPRNRKQRYEGRRLTRNPKEW